MIRALGSCGNYDDESASRCRCVTGGIGRDVLDGVRGGGGHVDYDVAHESAEEIRCRETNARHPPIKSQATISALGVLSSELAYLACGRDRRHFSASAEVREGSAPRVWLPSNPENCYRSRQFGSHLENSGLNACAIRARYRE